MLVEILFENIAHTCFRIEYFFSILFLEQVGLTKFSKSFVSGKRHIVYFHPLAFDDTQRTMIHPSQHFNIIEISPLVPNTIFKTC